MSVREPRPLSGTRNPSGSLGYHVCLGRWREEVWGRKEESRAEWGDVGGTDRAGKRGQSKSHRGNERKWKDREGAGQGRQERLGALGRPGEEREVGVCWEEQAEDPRVF